MRSALSFDTAAAQYGAARPGYPPALFDAVEELTGPPLKGSRVIDVGAGTGIATRLLRERGAHVTAVEPGPGMAAQLRRALPDIPLLRGQVPGPDGVVKEAYAVELSVTVRASGSLRSGSPTG